ncbi:Maf family protein [Aeromicrobium sp. UC242_57]
MRVVLASQSPARLATLRSAGIEPEVIVSGVDEDQISSTDAANLAAALAQLKCRAVASDVDGTALVIGCDSVLAFEGEIFGKPSDPAQAVARWRRLRGRSAVLHTGHCVRRGDVELIESASTIVHFAQVSDAEIDAYVATGEPLHVAGAFTIDGLGGAFISGIEGDHHNVVGLSLPGACESSSPSWESSGRTSGTGQTETFVVQGRSEVRDWKNDGNLTAAPPLSRVQPVPGSTRGRCRGVRGRRARLPRHLRSRPGPQRPGHPVGSGRLRRRRQAHPAALHQDDQPVANPTR